jgi:hypothetical protein
MSVLDDLARGPGQTPQDRNAGNAVDRLKHRRLVELIVASAPGAQRAPVFVDTHAGAGVYHHPERAAQMRRQLGAPDADSVHPYDSALNAYFRTTRTSVPGSPWLALHAAAHLRALRLCEFHPDHAARLRQLSEIEGQGEATAVFSGDYRVHLASLFAGPGPFIVHLDPFGVTLDDRGPAGWLGAEDLRLIGDHLAGESFTALVFLGHAEDQADLERRQAMIVDALRASETRRWTQGEGNSTYAVVQVSAAG